MWVGKVDESIAQNTELQHALAVMGTTRTADVKQHTDGTVANAKVQ